MDVTDAWLKAIRELKERRAEALVAGKVPDFATYKRLVGVIEGLNLAERELLDLQRIQQEQEDDE